jgi:hypothetical protein
MPKTWTCGCCGKVMDSMPMDLAFPEPLVIGRLSETERARDVTGEGGSDFRLLRQGDTEHYFVRGVLQLRVHELDDSFNFGVWSTLSENSFRSALELYQDDAEGGPFFGYLSNRISGVPDTLHLHLNVHFRPKLRPWFEVHESEHPLALMQRDGISLHQVAEFNSLVR